MSKQKQKCRQYSSEYLKYGAFPSVTNEKLPMCLISKKTFANEGMKPSRMIDHLKAKHPEKVNKDFAYFHDLKVKFEKRPTIGALFKSCRNEVEKGLIASYKVSKLIAKCEKSHNIGKTLIIPAVKEITSTMMATQKDVTPLIPLSNSTMSSRIDEMANDIENKLCDELKTTQFSLQLDETTLCDNEALLMAYEHYINASRKVIEEFLFAEQLEVDTKGSTVYKAVEQFFNPFLSFVELDSTFVIFRCTLLSSHTRHKN